MRTRRILSLAILALMMLSLLTGCFLQDTELGYDVNVNLYVDGELYKTVKVAGNGRIPCPDAPNKENMIFDGWYTDGIFAEKYDFYNPFYLDTNLYARYTLDAVKVTNMITDVTMESVVTVINKSYNSAAGGLVETESVTAQGSGVVIDISDGWCYVLTNCHVVQGDDSFEKQSITVEDPWSNYYEAQIYSNPKKMGYAMSTEYDLALICFQYTVTDPEAALSKITMGNDPKVGDYVISLGAPEGQRNSITYGKLIEYQKITVEEGDVIDGVKFDVILHDAHIDHGSSGGPLVDIFGKLIGLNFAGYNDGYYGCSIPISKVQEFLDLYVYN